MIFAKWLCFTGVVAQWCYSDPQVYQHPRTEAGCHALMADMIREAGEMRPKVEYSCVKVTTRFGE